MVDTRLSKEYIPLRFESKVSGPTAVFRIQSKLRLCVAIRRAYLFLKHSIFRALQMRKAADR